VIMGDGGLGQGPKCYGYGNSQAVEVNGQE
jgi:hypothetical protein